MHASAPARAPPSPPKRAPPHAPSAALAAPADPWRACERIFSASCFTSKLGAPALASSPGADAGGSPVSVLLSTSPSRGGAAGAGSHDDALCAEAVARRLRHRQYDW